MKIIKYLLLLVVVVILAAAVNTHFAYPDKQYHPQTKVNGVAVDSEAVAERLSQAIQLPTVSKDLPQVADPKPFENFHLLLEKNYPTITNQAERTLISELSVVYKFQGKDESLKPLLFMGHMDVVPVDEATLGQWQHPPYSGLIDDKWIWGRGAIDDKATVMALMEAMEIYLAQGNQLERSIYFAFGHDEEVGGKQGAAKVSEYFQQQQLEFEFVLDEGGAIVEGLLPGLEQKTAIIGVAEKGFVNIRLIVEQDGGHSSTPPTNTAAGVLAQAIVKLEQNQFPVDLAFTNMTFDAVGYYSGYPARFAMANQWLTSPLLTNALLANSKSAASIRTTTAATMLSGSSKSNILPTQASAVVNFRILPGETWESVKAHVVKVVNDPRVKLEVFMQNNPSPVSAIDAYGFELLEQSIREFDEQVLVAPYLVQGGTDSKYFYPLSNNIYRFLMITIDKELVKTFHGINERISKQDYVRSVQFFHEVIRKTSLN